MNVIIDINKPFIEIEARMKNITKAAYYKIFDKLHKSKYIQYTDIIKSIDYIYNSGMRKSVNEQSKEVLLIHKTTVNVHNYANYKLVSSLETPIESINGKIVLTRRKNRHIFRYKYLSYMLTEIEQSDKLNTLYEIEIEINDISHARSKNYLRLLSSIDMKVNQLVS
jgi:hypothetical protein